MLIFSLEGAKVYSQTGWGHGWISPLRSTRELPTFKDLSHRNIVNCYVVKHSMFDGLKKIAWHCLGRKEEKATHVLASLDTN